MASGKVVYAIVTVIVLVLIAWACGLFSDGKNEAKAPSAEIAVDKEGAAGGIEPGASDSAPESGLSSDDGSISVDNSEHGEADADKITSSEPTPTEEPAKTSEGESEKAAD